MTNPLSGEEIKTPSASAVVEHLFTVPMAFAALGTVCGWVASAMFFDADSPWQRLLQHAATGMPFLIAQLGQMWHSRFVKSRLGLVSPTEEKSDPQ